MPKLQIDPHNRACNVPQGTNLLVALRSAGVYPDAPCGGNGCCGKCRVLADGQEVLACRTFVDRDMRVTLPEKTELNILRSGIQAALNMDPAGEGHFVAFDIGTTSVVCYLLEKTTGREIAASSIRNPQVAFGADVISRIQAALREGPEAQTTLIRETMTELILGLCEARGISAGGIGTVSVVGNPAMQQLFLGINPENLAEIPFSPVLTEAKRIPCADVLPVCPNAELLILPDISGYIGADTLGCVLATGMYEKEEMTLMVDIGTNGEMVLGNKDRMIACSAAAGPALEGANIRFGMRGEVGAIDRVWLEEGKIRYSVIGNTEPRGICGSGLIDAIAVGLELGLLNRRGRIQNEGRIFRLTETIYLTQEDIRQVQLAKGAIHAGIVLMAKQLGLEIRDIQRVQLAGAFGNYLNPASACRMGLLPEELLDRIEPVGNAAGVGAKMLACDQGLLPLAQKLCEKIEFLELASMPTFPRTFARSMNFREEIG